MCIFHTQTILTRSCSMTATTGFSVGTNGLETGQKTGGEAVWNIETGTNDVLHSDVPIKVSGKNTGDTELGV